MAQLSITLMGTFTAALHGQAVSTFRSQKCRALLAILATEVERSFSREYLAALLWPERPYQVALAYLRNTLSDLRLAIGDAQAEPPHLDISRQSIRINPYGNVWVDLTAFQEYLIRSEQDPATRMSDLEMAMALVRGPFLDGFLCGSAVFEEWALIWRERISRLACESLGRLAQLYAEHGEHRQSVRTARRLLAFDPWDEQAHRLAMQGLAMSGQRTAALAHFDGLRHTLQEELGIEPSPDTVNLAENIRAGSMESASAAKPKEIRDFQGIQPHLPQPLTSFIGREVELAEILRMLGRMPSLQPREPMLRLLTLSGAGGCGKTRLALAVAHNLAEAGWYPQGVWWVDLSAISEPALVPASVARVFGIFAVPSASILQRMTNDLREKELLLIFDSCEHLVEAVAALAVPLLEECPRLQILATSRGPIGIPGETVWRVPSLPFPSGIKNARHVEEIRRFDSVRLFEERAQSVMPGWRLSAEPASAAEICSRLDGIPLAIELAAGRLRVMTAEQIAARLDDVFHLLTGGSRSTLPRHQTLRACIDWSYDLLSPGERALLRQLSIIQGDWVLDVVEYFDRIDPLPAVPFGECVDIFSDLLDHSLVESRRKEHEMRYHLLGAIRQFALRKLSEAGEEADARRRYQAYKNDLAARTGGGDF